MISVVHRFVSKARPELRRTNGVGDMSKDICVTTAMTSAVEYRQYAEECLAAMRAAVIPEVRAALFTAAQRWTALADRMEEDEDLSTPAHGGRHLSGGEAVASAR
jgi:hypothetical protein